MNHHKSIINPFITIINHHKSIIDPFITIINHHKSITNRLLMTRNEWHHTAELRLALVPEVSMAVAQWEKKVREHMGKPWELNPPKLEFFHVFFKCRTVFFDLEILFWHSAASPLHGSLKKTAIARQHLSSSSNCWLDASGLQVKTCWQLHVRWYSQLLNL